MHLSARLWLRDGRTPTTEPRAPAENPKHVYQCVSASTVAGWLVRSACERPRRVPCATLQEREEGNDKQCFVLLNATAIQTLGRGSLGSWIDEDRS